jgi:drug/metabolite transporter (DMT)-like permease
MTDRAVFGYLAAAGAITIYAGMFAVGRAGAAAGLDGYDQTALRFAVSAALILPFGLLACRGILSQIGVWRCVMLAILNGATYSAVFLGGLTFAPVAYGAALVPGLQPFVVMLLSLLVVGQRPARPVLIGNLVCLTGLLVVLADQQGAWQADRLIGIGLFLCAALMWGSYAFFVRQWSVPARTALLIIGSLSPLMFLPVYLYFSGFSVLAAAPEAIMLQMIYQGLLVGIVAVFLYPYAIAVLGSTQVAALSPAMPLLATLLGVFFISENPSDLQWTGVAVVTIGLCVSQVGSYLAKSH